MTLISYLRDEFDGAQVDLSKWEITGSVVISSGALQLASSTPSTVTSVRDYSLVGSGVVAHLEPLGSGASREFTLACKVDGNNEVSFFQTNDTLKMRLRVAGVDNDTSIAIDRATMLYWRIKERSGLCYWDTSADGLSWTSRRVGVHGLDLTALSLFMKCDGASGSAPDTTRVLSVNAPIVVPSTVPPVVVPDEAPSWQWSIGNWHDQLGSTELVMAGARSLSLHLKDPSEARFTTWGYSDEASNVDELITDLWCNRDGSYLYRGRIVNVDDQLEADAYALSCTAIDYRGVLDRRLLYTDFSLTAQEQSSIVGNLIDHTQGQLGGDLSLVRSTPWPTTGVLRTTEFRIGDSVWESIRSLAEMDSGFDLQIDFQKIVTLSYPELSRDNGEILDFGGVVTRVRRVFDPSTFANAIRQSGAEGVTASIQTVLGLDTAPEGRWDGQYGNPDLRTSDAVAKTAKAKLLQTSMLLPSYQLTLAKGAWRGPGHIWLGDYVTPVVQAGRLNEIVKARVYDLDIELDANGQETVTVTVGDPRIDVRSYLRGISKRIQSLEK